MTGKIPLLRCQMRRSAPLPWIKTRPATFAAGRVCYVSVFGKTNLDCAIAANNPYDNQRKSNQQKAQPFLAFLKMQDGVCNMDNLEQQPA